MKKDKGNKRGKNIAPEDMGGGGGGGGEGGGEGGGVGVQAFGGTRCKPANHFHNLHDIFALRY